MKRVQIECSRKMVNANHAVPIPDYPRLFFKWNVHIISMCHYQENGYSHVMNASLQNHIIFRKGQI